MVLGILSDTHDQYDRMGVAISTLQQRGAQFFIHCGDVCQPHLLDHLVGLPNAFVYGNCDWDRPELARYSDAIGVRCHGQAADLELDGKRIAIVHGDDRALLDKLIGQQTYDYLFHGHTHIRRDDRVGITRIINPGALHRAAEKTVAILDTAGDGLEFIRIG